MSTEQPSVEEVLSEIEVLLKSKLGVQAFARQAEGLLASAARLLRGQQEAVDKVLGPRCPCKCADEPWHQRGVCREGEAVLIAAPAQEDQ